VSLVKITGYSAEGAGVARLESGCVVFVDGAVRGDLCEIEVVKSLPRVSYGRIVQILEESEHRISVDCPYFGDCGGCDFRHISYEEELWAKKQRVNDALKRIGGVRAKVEEVLTTGNINGYRNNLQLKTDGDKTGFYAKDSHKIVAIDRCFLASEEMNEAIAGGQTRIRTGEEIIGGLRFVISPDSFFQVNSAAGELLFKKVRELANLKPQETFLDLYCGTGSITLFLARDAKRAIGVEINSAAIENARENAAINSIANAEFLCGDAADFCNEPIDCIIADPPRKGLDRRAIAKIIEISPPRMVYVSCDPATMARDIKLLCGYEVSHVCAVDMFPRTRHVECAALLERCDGG
jgi:23S rRNA (uracil1939-C5)-methyltransferase